MGGQRISIMHRLLTIMAGLVLSGVALADPLPLNINVGANPNDRSGDGLRTAFTKTMLAVNALNAMRGAPNGVATLDGEGRLIGAQGPTSLAPKFVGMTQIGIVNKDLAGTRNPNAMLFGAGNSISFCPALSCIYGPSDGSLNPAFFDHQRASLLLSTATQMDAQAEEQTLAVTTTIGSGRLRTYAANTAYALGDNVLVPNAIYRVTQAGTTGANSKPPGTRPTTAPFIVTDGTVRFQWINDQAIGGKLGVYFETQAVAGSGSAWGFANNFQIQPGAVYENAVRYGFENDFTNNDIDCPLGIDCTAFRIGVGGKKSTQGIDITTANTATPALIWGLRFDGANLASESQIACDAGGSKACLATNALGNGVSFSQAFISDRATAPVGYAQSGTYTNGIALNGAYSNAQIVGSGFSVLPNGSVSTAQLGVTDGGVIVTPTQTGSAGGVNKVALFGGLNASGYGFGVSPSSLDYVVPTGTLHSFYASGSSVSSFKIGAMGPIEPQTFTPTSSAATCTAGQHAWDANYEYRCVATNTWKRAALSTW